MIRYNLRCAKGHRFDSWFQDSETFERLSDAGHVTCSVCGESGVVKAPMAPRIASGTTPDEEPATPLSGPPSPAEAALRELRARIEAESDYVGNDFAEEARRIHHGESEHRPIYGEATQQDAFGLIEDGIPVAPLPFPIRGRN